MSSPETISKTKKQIASLSAVFHKWIVILIVYFAGWIQESLKRCSILKQIKQPCTQPTSYRNIWQLCFTQTWLVINIIPTCTWAVVIFYSFICRVKLIVCLKLTQNKSGSPLFEMYDCFDSFCTFCMISSWHAIRSHFQALLPIFYTQSGKLLFLFCH